MRARMALYYSKIDYEHREILLRNRPEKLYQLSQKGTVPVLELPNGDVIDESFDIMKWALSINDPEMWFDKNKEEQVDLIKLNDDKFKKWLDKYKYHVRFPEYPLEYYRRECEKILDIYEVRLKDKSFLFGATISLADVAIMPFVRQFSNVDIGYFNNRFTFLSKWKQSLISLEIFSKMMNKFEVWEENKDGESILFT
ncbi:MAG: hypothetical protein CBC40_03865 [bacterium TMED80]|nr:MAG: hypothetical protein CBC40_03865 [bacterium TMED80]